MKSNKVVSLPFVHQVLTPIWHNLVEGAGVEEIDAAEFRVRKAVAGNAYAIKTIFETIERQARDRKSFFGPFLFVGATGVGKSTLARALCTDPESPLYVEAELGGLKESHTISTILGAVIGYEGGKELSKFGKKLNAMNDALAAYEGPETRQPLPVLLLDRADDAHPEVTASLTNLILKGSQTFHRGDQIQLNRCLLAITVSKCGSAVEALRFHSQEKWASELKRLVRSLKNDRGAERFPDSVIEASTIIPLFEPSPAEVLAFLSMKFGREIALACGLGDKQAGRVRMAPSEMSWLRHWAEIKETDSASHILAAMEAAWKDVKYSYIVRAWHQRDQITQKPPKGEVYTVTVSRPQKQLLFTAAALADPQEITADFPIPYLERTMGESAVRRSDYWELPSQFEKTLSDQITGQAKLVAAIGGAIRNRLMEAGDKPVLSAIVVGPTGTGKTELGRELSLAAGCHLLVCPCNRWKTEEVVSEGIFGTGATSVATHIRHHPASVIIFDEVDKAHPKFWDFFMDACDTGKIVDNQTGRSISLRNAIIWLTSNYMADRLGGLAALAVEKSIEEIDPLIRKALSACAQIHSACLERLDIAGLMMPLEGENSYRMWTKFVTSKLVSTNHCGVTFDDEIAPYLESRHIDKGGAAGARARARSCDDLFGRWLRGGTDDFELKDNRLMLSAAAREWHRKNPAPRSERQRMWSVTDEKIRRLHAEYLGNGELLESVIADLRVEGLKVNPIGPVGVILAAGPTGSGKSYLGKALAKAFGKDDAIEIRCAQCSEESQVTPFLFGASVGYVGAEKGGQLTAPVLVRKDRVIIFDEIEKAHPAFLNKLLNVLDEGMATEMGSQLPVDLKQCFFVLTCNLAADELQARMEEMETASLDDKEAAAREIIARTGRFSPEQLARIQHVFALTYNRGEDGGVDISGAVLSVLEEFGKSDLRLGEEVARQLTEKCGGLPQTDVRAMRRLIQKELAPVLFGETEGLFVIVDNEVVLAGDSGAWNRKPQKHTQENR